MYDCEVNCLFSYVGAYPYLTGMTETMMQFCFVFIAAGVRTRASPMLESSQLCRKAETLPLDINYCPPVMTAILPISFSLARCKLQPLLYRFS